MRTEAEITAAIVEEYWRLHSIGSPGREGAAAMSNPTRPAVEHGFLRGKDTPTYVGRVEPTVCCICLTKDRPEMLKRAVASFRAQTYENKKLIIWDTSKVPFALSFDLPANECCVEDVPDYSIGELRNRAHSYPLWGDSDIIAHWDSDDWSHPSRITEQVALLQASGAECVGYNSALFWDTTKCQIEVDPSRRGPDGVGCLGTVKSVGEAWLYRALNPKHILGTSLMYWRSTWERQPFDDVRHGEDTLFVKKLKSVVGVSSIGSPVVAEAHPPDEDAPRMVASVHGANSSGYAPEKDRASTRRVVEWDTYCRRVMELK